MRQKMLLVVAVVFGLLAFFLTYYQIAREKQRIRGETIEIELVRVTSDKLEGDTLAVGDLVAERTRRYPKDFSDNDVRWERRNDVIGQRVGRTIRQGELLRYSDLAMVGMQRRSGLAGMIEPGERAISIAVDATASVTGLVRPNDKVDIIGTFRFPEMRGDQALDTITLTVLQDVLVLATGTETSSAAGMAAGRNQGNNKGYSTVTLALTPKEVEMFVFASQKGRLTLSLRNPDETKVETDLQSVNFRYLEQNIPKYTEERQQRKINRRR